VTELTVDCAPGTSMPGHSFPDARPDAGPAAATVLDSVTSPHSRRNHAKAMTCSSPSLQANLSVRYCSSSGRR
jgi:hypothetical protein